MVVAVAVAVAVVVVGVFGFWWWSPRGVVLCCSCQTGGDPGYLVRGIWILVKHALTDTKHSR